MIRHYSWKVNAEEQVPFLSEPTVEPGVSKKADLFVAWKAEHHPAEEPAGFAALFVDEPAGELAVRVAFDPGRDLPLKAYYPIVVGYTPDWSWAVDS